MRSNYFFIGFLSHFGDYDFILCKCILWNYNTEIYTIVNTHLQPSMGNLQKSHFGDFYHCVLWVINKTWLNIITEQ